IRLALPNTPSGVVLPRRRFPYAGRCRLAGLARAPRSSPFRLITDVAKRPGPDAADWVFYLWEEDKPQLDPQWKSAYVCVGRHAAASARAVSSSAGVIFAVTRPRALIAPPSACAAASSNHIKACTRSCDTPLPLA